MKTTSNTLRKLPSRKVTTVNAEELIRLSYIDFENRFPLVVERGISCPHLAGWIAGQRDFVKEQLRTHGAILFRGFNVNSPEEFRDCAAALSQELLNYTERAAPRQQISSNIYTSTEFPADQSIPLHHEMSYSHHWPLKIWFYCAQNSKIGGCTPIVDDRRVFPLIDERLRDKFLEKKVMYVRNFGEGADMSWMEVFQTDDRNVVEKYCQDTGIEFEWRSGNRLRTRQVRQAVLRHPETKDLVWFNHAHLFHMSNLPPAVRAALLSQFRDDELPRNAFYGDGSRITDETLEEIRRIYNDTAVRFPWQNGDVLLADNILVSHGREPYEGPRKILVAMAEMFTNPE
ncbi:MAG TPA: TauD/TfdA family dioxygenase [Candidatus Angelobacter sp.]|jgi:alpha-ketoglutarate-dependent taurine dioxygenase